jgi:hypothetical protein
MQTTRSAYARHGNQMKRSKKALTALRWARTFSLKKGGMRHGESEEAC